MVLGTRFRDGWPLRRLHGECHGHPAFLPRGFPLFQPSVVEFAAAPPDCLQHLRLGWSWYQPVFEGFREDVVFHVNSFRLMSGQAESNWDSRRLTAAGFPPMPEGRGTQPDSLVGKGEAYAQLACAGASRRQADNRPRLL